MKQLSHSPEAAAYFKGMRALSGNVQRIARPKVASLRRSVTHIAPLQQQMLGNETRPSPPKPA